MDMMDILFAQQTSGGGGGGGSGAGSHVGILSMTEVKNSVSQTEVTVEVVPISPCIHEWDFTKSLIDDIGGAEAKLYDGATQDAMGITIPSAGANFRVSNMFKEGYKYEIDIAEMSKTFSSGNGRFLMGSSWDSGVAYCSKTGLWSVYSPNGWWSSEVYDANLASDPTAFSGSTMTVEVYRNSPNIKVYKGDTLVFTSDPSTDYPFSNGTLMFGSNANSFYTVRITGLRVYDMGE